jgi:hypothetical protein
MKYLGFVLLVLSGYVMAEEVYYCSDTHNYGLQNNKLTSFGMSKNKFRVEVTNNGNIVIETTFMGRVLSQHYMCEDDDNFDKPNLKSCITMGSHFLFSPDTGKFVWSDSYEYVAYRGFGNEALTRVGTCN